MFTAVLAFAVAVSGARNLETYTFDEYVKEFGKVYSSTEFATRKALFDATLLDVLKHNTKPGVASTMGINHMSDWTDAEYRNLLGYRKDLARHHRANTAVPEFKSKVDPMTLPAAVDWRLMDAVTPVKNQGLCGSCWTFASASTIESHYFLATGKMQELSQQQIAGCTKNPEDCGGTGGCEGGIAQLAFAGVISAGGLASEWTYPYISYFGQDFPCAVNLTKTGVGAKIASYANVASNDYASLMEAVATIGPVSISLDASSFKNYAGGVWGGCNMDSPDINHAVQLVGYGTDSQAGDYWLVRNSWGPTWGENGYIRIGRQADRQVCGVDSTPHDGSGCDNGPSNVTVCGFCGILYDNTYPIV